MGAPATADDFLALVSRSGLVDPATLEATRERLRMDPAGTGPPESTAETLVRDGVLTLFQARQFLQGRGRNCHIARYRVLELIATGGMARVYLCLDPESRRLVAAKVLPSAMRSNPEAVARFKREARATHALKHPNIVQALEVGRLGRQHYLIMEHVDGCSLQDIVACQGPLDLARAAHYTAQAAAGLQHAFEAGWVHRDIKPANLLVDRHGTVKILDFGLARLLRGSGEQITDKYDDKTVLGTADYVAPEQVMQGRRVDIRADVYGLGATLFFQLAGRAPFAEGTVAQKLLWHLVRDAAPLDQLRPEIPWPLAQLVARMMAKDPDKRPGTPAEVIEALRPWVPEAVPPPPEGVIPPLGLGVRRFLASGVPGRERKRQPAPDRPPADRPTRLPPGRAGSGSWRPRCWWGWESWPLWTSEPEGRKRPCRDPCIQGKNCLPRRVTVWEWIPLIWPPAT